MKNKLTLLLFSLSFIILNMYAQNYVGAGNSSGISVYSSSEYRAPNWIKKAKAKNTIEEEGLESKIFEASRFLSQATIGFEKDHIDDVLNLGLEGWINEQMEMPTTLTLENTWAFYHMTNDSVLLNQPEDLDEDSDFRPGWYDFEYAWWDAMMKNEDLLRHRIAMALAQIFVVSRKSDLGAFGDALASFYDMLAKNAFGLKDVALHPAMGIYLSHFENSKAEPDDNMYPDQNFAREVMQLFTIGLYELNIDGSRLTAADGNFISTYDQNDIEEFAKIFTGLGPAGIIENPGDPRTLEFDLGTFISDHSLPMKMYEDYHEPGEKHLLRGKIVPAGQTGLKDIEDAVHNLFMHPNVGPFISYRLIQRLVKSNPSPAYIARVAQVFNNNGKGVRGDLSAVVKAILLDGEARACPILNNGNNSRLKEPLLRFTHFVRAVDKYNPYDLYWNVSYNFDKETGQGIFSSPSVFNFYLPDHMPYGPIDNANLVAPEHRLH